MQSVLNVVYLAIALVVALVVHEFAHAAVATRLGDHSPRSMGRMTLDPRPHIDPFGTILLPALLLLPWLFGSSFVTPVFAYAKPMPLNPWNLRKPEQHTTFIAAAGILANVALAFVFGAILRVAGSGQAGLFVVFSLQVNVIMAAMHIIPIPGLDGSRIVARFLSPRAREVYANLDQYAALFMLLVFFLLANPVLSFVSAIGNGICHVVAGVGCLT